MKTQTLRMTSFVSFIVLAAACKVQQTSSKTLDADASLDTQDEEKCVSDAGEVGDQSGPELGLAGCRVRVGSVVKPPKRPAGGGGGGGASPVEVAVAAFNSTAEALNNANAAYSTLTSTYQAAVNVCAPIDAMYIDAKKRYPGVKCGLTEASANTPIEQIAKDYSDACSRGKWKVSDACNIPETNFVSEAAGTVPLLGGIISDAARRRAAAVERCRNEAQSFVDTLEQEYNRLTLNARVCK